MAKQGRKIDDKTREEIRAYYASCGNKKATARNFGISESTVRKIVNESDDFAELRAQKKSEHIEKAWQTINAYIAHINRPDLIAKTNARDSAIVIGTMWDKVIKERELELKRRELELKQEENELKRQELKRKEEGPKDADVSPFINALKSDTEQLWDDDDEEE